jgi:glycosyltransferase involved in cell wall biosynthesis
MRLAPDLSDPSPLVVFSANNCWNLIHFRKALFDGIGQAGFRTIALVPIDRQARELESRGIEVRHVPMARSGMNPLSDMWLMLQYFRLLRELRPAAYCGFTIKPNVYGAIAAHIAGVPVIANITGMGTSFLSKGLLWSVAEQLYRLALQRSDVVFFHNEDDRRQFLERGIVRAPQARVIPGSGVDLDRFVPSNEDSERQDNQTTFLFIGRLIYHKGIREFIEAARLVRRSLPQVRFQLLGNPDPGNPTSVTERELRSWIDEGVVEHLGEHEDVRPFVRNSTVVVLPSYREGMSRALLEAAAMGKPLIGANVPGCRELIADGVEGYRCEARDAGSLARAMSAIAELPANRRGEMGRAARRKVEERFGEKLVVEEYLKALSELVPSRQ